MQRQSLGSPSKLQISAGKEERKDEEEEKRKQAEEEVKKAEKILKSTSRTDKSIHLIPVITIFCFLLLYLASYDPSQKEIEMANAGALKGYFRGKDPTEFGDFGRLLEMGKSASSAILVGRRTLKEDIRFHRKFGYFQKE